MQKKYNFNPPSRIELDYRRSLDNLFLRYLNFSPTSTVDDILGRLSKLIASARFLEDFATTFSRRMITQVRNQNAKSWRAAARESSRGPEIYESLREELQGPVGVRVNELITENARLIGSVPQHIAQVVAREIARMQQRGARPETIVQNIRKRVPKLTKNRIALIARTESSKASTALTHARSESLGLYWYMWQTSHDRRVRDSHKLMGDVLVPWKEPPAPEALFGERSSLGHYHGGDAPNCRCICLPLVSLDQISWPSKVYWSGRIQRMGKLQFQKINLAEGWKAA